MCKVLGLIPQHYKEKDDAESGDMFYRKVYFEGE
jgi:hypothetical protein